MVLGVDISTWEEVERLGGRFYEDGEQKELIEILKNQGTNSVRLRLWVNPYDDMGNPYGAGGCDTESVLRMAERAKEAGMTLLLDFHYSDFWCDPARQLLPKRWRNLSFEALCEKVHDYTKETLCRFAKEGVTPEYVQVGNEITGGMLWPHGKLFSDVPDTPDKSGKNDGYKNLTALLKAGTEAVRESSNAKIILHLERSYDNAAYRDWFDHITEAGISYDIIGVSYYCYWHRDMNALKVNLEDMITRYNKEVMIVETAYAFTLSHHGRGGKKMVVDESFVMPEQTEAPYPFTKEGQRQYMEDLLSLLSSLKDGKGTGIYYWEPAWLPVEGTTWATEAARAYIGEEEKEGGNEWANQCLFDYDGYMNPALGEYRRFLCNTHKKNRF